MPRTNIRRVQVGIPLRQREEFLLRLRWLADDFSEMGEMTVSCDHDDPGMVGFSVCFYSEVSQAVLGGWTAYVRHLARFMELQDERRIPLGRMIPVWEIYQARFAREESSGG